MPPRAVSSPDLGPPLGMYSHGMIAPPGALVVVAGQVGAAPAGEAAGDVAVQTRRAFDNVRRVLAAAGCTMRDVVRFQTFLIDAADIESFMRARRELFPRYFPDGVYPPNTLLVVSRLVQPELRVEIEAMAVRGAPAPARGRGGAGAVTRRPASRTKARSRRTRR